MIPIQSVPKQYKNFVLILGVTFVTVSIVKAYLSIRLDLKELKEG